MTIDEACRSCPPPLSSPAVLVTRRCVYNGCMSLESHVVVCPYCGEEIEIDVESMNTEQSYVEDCSVCCRPIQLSIQPGDDGPMIDAQRSE